MVGFSEGFSRGFGLVDSVMAREEREKRARRLDAESMRHSKVMEGQGQETLDLKREQQTWERTEKFQTEQARLMYQANTSRQSVENNFDLASQRLTFDRGKHGDSLKQLLIDNKYRDDVFSNNKDEFSAQHKIRKDEFRIKAEQWDQNKVLQEKLMHLKEMDEGRTHRDWQQDRIRQLFGESLTAGQAMAKNADRADKSQAHTESKDLVMARMYLMEKQHQMRQDSIMNEFTQKNYNLNVDQFKQGQSEFFKTFNEGMRISDRNYQLNSMITGKNGQILDAQLTQFNHQNLASGMKLDKDTKLLFLSKVAEFNQDGTIADVHLDTPAQLSMFQQVTGINLFGAYFDAQEYQSSFAEINKGDFGSEGFTKAVNHIYSDQINSTVGSTIDRDVFATAPDNVETSEGGQVGGEKAPGWSFFGSTDNMKLSRLAPLAAGLADPMGGASLGKDVVDTFRNAGKAVSDGTVFSGGLNQQTAPTNKGVNLSGGRVVGAEFSGVSPLKSGESMEGVPMIRTFVRKDGKIYSYEAPLTQGRSSRQGDKVKPVGMEEFMYKVKGMEQMLTTVQMSNRQKQRFDRGGIGNEAGARYMDNHATKSRLALAKAAAMTAGIKEGSELQKEILKGDATLNAKSLKALQTFLPVDATRFYTASDQSRDMVRVLRSLTSVKSTLMSLNVPSGGDWGKMSNYAKGEVINAFTSAKNRVENEGASYAEDGYLQDWVNSIVKMRGKGTGGLNQGRKKDDDVAFNFGGEWKTGGW